MVLYGNYLICIFMNTNENLKMRTKLLHKLEPKGLFRPALDSYEYFFFMPNGSVRQFKGKNLCSIINPISNLKCMVSMAIHYDWESSYKNIHITAAIHPRTLNLVSNKSADIARLHDGRICR